MGHFGPQFSASRNASHFGFCQPLSGSMRPGQIDMLPNKIRVYGSSRKTAYGLPVLAVASRCWQRACKGGRSSS